MSSSISRRRVAIARTLTSLCLLGLAGSSQVGCSDIITYSNRSQAKGKELLDQGRFEEAAGAFRDSTRQNPSNHTSFYYLGVCYQQLGREQQALQAYTAAIDVLPPRLGPSDKEEFAFREMAIEGLAQCAAKATARDVEIANLDARAHTKRRAIDWYILARTYAAAGDADSAIEAYDRAMDAADRTDQRIAKSFGLYLVQVNQARRAEAVLTTAYRLDPTDTQVEAALRRLGVVPGPSLLDEGQLSHPILPKGPIPELELNVKDRNKPQ